MVPTMKLWTKSIVERDVRQTSRHKIAFVKSQGKEVLLSHFYRWEDRGTGSSDWFQVV